MKAFFKENDKIIINSMDYTEALVGKQFLNDLAGKVLIAEQRNDINDDFDGLVLTIALPPSAGEITIVPTTEYQEINPPEGLGFSKVNVEPVTSGIDSNIRPENILRGVSILGVDGIADLATFDGSGFFYTVIGSVSDPVQLLESPGIEHWELWIHGANEFGESNLILKADNYSLTFRIEATSENSAVAISPDGLSYMVEITTDPETGDKQLVVEPEN